ncbi:MAG: hypothetical protein EBT69_06690, partial [Verrucomicrobia bacterium]|nr:hypothetical protein [Verrucomicrobiota bacterium]
ANASAIRLDCRAHPVTNESIDIIAGARPNFMKIAPIVRSMDARRAPPDTTGISDEGVSRRGRLVYRIALHTCHSDAE